MTEGETESATESTLAGSAPARPVTLRAGEAIGRYLVLERLGVGGMGVVYAAYDPELDRKIALKLLLPPVVGQRPALRAQARLQREARALARLSHPHVVALHDVGTHGDQLWIAMEFVEGETLDAYCRRVRPSWRARLELLEQAGRGVAALHAAGLIHRDLKPANIMVTDEPRRGPRVRVMDLGLARSDEDASTDATSSDDRQPLHPALTEAGATPGTPAYMAPEQHAGRHLDATADQFGFCVLAWEILTGERPFTGATRNEVAAAILSGTRQPIPSHVTLPRAIRQTLERGLSPLREDRFDNMEALLAALGRGDGTRRRAWLGAAFLGINAAVWLSVGGTEREADPCQALADEAASTWSDADRRRIADRLAVVDAAALASTMERLQTRLEAWTDDWGAAAQQRCAAGDPPPEEPEEGAWACLHRQRQIVAEQLDVAASSERWFEALDAVTSLPKPSRCLDDRLVALGVASGSVLGDDALAVEARRIASLAAGHHHRRLEPLARQLARDADAAGRSPVAVRARLHLGGALHRLGRYADSVEVLQEGFRQASRIGDEAIALQIAESLVWAAHDAGHLDRAEVWLDTARHLSVQLGVEGDVEGAAIDLAEAYLYWGQGRDFEALARTDRASDTIRANVGVVHPLYVRALAQRGLIQTDRGKWDEARTALERGLAIAEALWGDEHPQVAILLNDLGRLDFRARHLARARRHLARAHAIKASAFGPESLRAVWALDALSLVEGAAGDYDLSTIHGTQVVESVLAASSIEPGRITSVALRAARMALFEGDVDRARRLYDRLQAKLPTYEPDDPGIRIEKGILAAFLAREEGHDEVALALMRRAETIVAHDPKADSIPEYLPPVIDHLLAVLVLDSDPDEAGMLLVRAKESCRLAYGARPGPCWYIDTAQARLALRRGDAASARSFAESALEQISQARSFETDVVEVVLVWGRALAATGDPADLAQAMEVAASLEDMKGDALPTIRREIEAWKATLPKRRDHSAAGSESAGR